MIDYLHVVLSTARRAQNRQQEIVDISNGVNSLVRELNVPIVVLSGLNCEWERGKNRKARMSDLCGSGAIEQEADLIGLLYRPNADDEESRPAPAQEEPVPVNLLITEQCNGSTGGVHLTFLKT